MLYLDKGSSVPLYLQLYQELKREITEGVYESTPLPPLRNLATELSVSKNTVIQAYQQLLAEGYIYSVPGSGYFCNTIVSNLGSENITFSSSISVAPQRPLPRFVFRYGGLDNNLFPWNTWKKCLRMAIQQEESNHILGYREKQGYFPLRKALSVYLKATRGVNCTPEQIIICCGIQESISILMGLLPIAHYRVGLEDPGYDGVKNAFLRHGYSIFPFPVDEKGIIIENLYNSDSNLIYVTPSHQFPTGGIMPITRRTQLLSLIHERNGFVIEDDYDSEFQYSTSSLIPSLQSLDTNDQVIYLGGFSKSFSPTIRVSYMIIPQRLLPIYQQKFENYKSSVSDLIQRALYEFIQQGSYVRHLRKVSLNNEKKYFTIINLLREQKYIQPLPSNTGLYLLIRLQSELSHEQILQLLEENGVRLFPTTHYWINQAACDPSLFLLGFASMSQEEITAGITHLIDVITRSRYFFPFESQPN